jgi:hypothetical protein
MTETVHNDYEVSSEGAVRHWTFPYARLRDATPTPTNASQVIGLLLGANLCGTILTIDAGRSMAVIDVTASMVYRHDVRNVLTYNPGVAELTWGVLNIGDPVYYDGSASMPAGVYLSTSPLNTGATANTLFGWIVPAPLAATFDTDSALFPLGGAISGTTHRVAVMQRGAGG